MNIALNAQLISDQGSYRGAGVNNYARQLLRALGALAISGKSNHHFVAYVHVHGFRADGVEVKQSKLPLEHPLARIAWEQLVLPLQLARGNAGLVHGLVNVLPLATQTPGLVTVHDLSFVRTPEKLPVFKRTYLTRLCAASVARAQRVIAVSVQTADDLEQCFGAVLDKIAVVHNGVAPEFTPGDPAVVAQYRSAMRLPARYLLYLGTLEPRKNLELLIRAFARWRRQAGAADQDMRLVLAGGKGWYYETIFAHVEALGLTESVLFPGFIPAPDLPNWYRGAEAFIYPSLFEGFGLPVLEAMACGAPVLCSQTASLLEVAGQAALTFPAIDEDALVHSLQLLVGQPALRSELRRRGLAQAALFGASVPKRLSPFMTNSDLRWPAIAGMAGAILLGATIVVLTVLEYDFLRSLGWHPVTAPTLDRPSGLILGPLGFWMAAAFVGCGGLLAIFAWGLSVALRPGRTGKVGARLLILSGGAVAALAFLPDPTLRTTPATPAGMLHDLAYVVLAATLALALLLLALGFHHEHLWRRWTWPTAVLIAIVGPIFIVKGPAFYLLLVGLITWLFGIAFRLYSISSTRQSLPEINLSGPIESQADL